MMVCLLCKILFSRRTENLKNKVLILVHFIANQWKHLKKKKANEKGCIEYFI